MGFRSYRRRHGSGVPRQLLALLALVLAAAILSGCGEGAKSAPPGPAEPLNLEQGGKAAANAALLAAAEDRHVKVRRARRLGVTQCRPDPDEESDAVFCHVEFTAYRGSLRRFCTRAYRVTRNGETAAPAEGWRITCLRYSGRKAARAARDGKVSPSQARRQARARE